MLVIYNACYFLTGKRSRQFRNLDRNPTIKTDINFLYYFYLRFYSFGLLTPTSVSDQEL